MADLGAFVRQHVRTQPLFFLALAACSGILLGDLFPSPIAFGSVVALLLIAVFLTSRPWLVGLLAASAFGLIHVWHLESTERFPYRETLLADAEGKQVTVQGRVITAPRALSYGQQAVFALSAIHIEGEHYHLPHRILVRVPGNTLSYGDVMTFSGNLSIPESPRNPGQFDYRTFLRRHDWIGILQVGEADTMTRLGREGHPFKALALRARARMAAFITRDIEKETDICAVLTAMVLGMREQASPELEAPFRYSGTLHIFAVSGLHVGIFALIAWFLLKPFGLSRAQTAWILIPLLFCYAFLTGWRPSAVRAATMATVYLAAFCVHREPRLLNSLGLAALLILALNTNQLFLSGFQLSFAVLLSIIGLTKRIQGRFRRWLYPDSLIPTSLLEDHEMRAYAMRRWLGDIVSVSLAAWIGSLPLMAWKFHLLTPVAVLANCILMPLGFFILFTAAISMLTGGIPWLAWASILCNNANVAFVSFLLGVAQFFSSLPGSHYLVSTRLPFTRPAVELTVLDLPRGASCHHLAVRGGSHELLDIGHANDFYRFTEPYVRHAGLNEVDRLWLTHGDTSHVSGAPEFLQNYEPKVYRAPWQSTSPSMRSVQQLLGERQTPARILQAGEAVPVDDVGHWEVLYPPADETFAPSNADDRGLVLRLHVHGWRLLFLADAGFHTERWLLESGAEIHADVLLKDYHPDDINGTRPFIDAVNPQVIIADSDSGDLSSLERWAQRHERLLFDQRQDGAIILGIEDDALRVRGFLSKREQRLEKAMD